MPLEQSAIDAILDMPLEEKQRIWAERKEMVKAGRVAWLPMPGPQELAFRLADVDEVMTGGARGGGKGHICLPPRVLRKLMQESPDCSEEEIRMKHEGLVLTPFGFKPIGLIKPGDSVCNPDGTVAHVLQVHELPEKDYYRIEWLDGAVVECCEDHLWGVNLSNSRRGKKRGTVDLTRFDLPEEMRWNMEYQQRCTVVDTLMLSELHGRASEQQAGGRLPPQWLKTPITCPVAFNSSFSRSPDRPGFVPPYTLGVLIGDGCLTRGAEFSKGDDIQIDLVREDLEQSGIPFEIFSNVGARQHRINGGMRDRLNRLKLIGCRAEMKFVPKTYLHAPEDVRLALIQGIMDTDGYVDDRGHLEYCTVSKQLATDVQFLLRSLGYVATITDRPEPKYSYKGEMRTGQHAYRIYVKGRDTDRLFRLPRKRDRCRAYNGGAGGADPFNRITHIEKIGRHVGRCITVSHPNRLYITNDFVVTHNSSSLLGMAGAHIAMHKKVDCLILRPSLPTLEEVIRQAREMFVVTGLAEYKKQEKTFVFKNEFEGSTIKMRHLERLEDCDLYQGHSYQFLGCDEVGTFADWEIIERMKATLRSASGVPSILRLTCNPGGKLHNDMRREFVDASPGPGQTWKGPDDSLRAFVPSLVSDNLEIMANDPKYVQRLDALRVTNPPLYQAWRHGSWDVALGSYFGDVFDRDLHVISRLPGHKIPKSWPRYRCFDWGSSTPFACLWYFISNGEETSDGRSWPRGSIIFFREEYGEEPGERNVGLRLTSSEVGALLRRREDEDGDHHLTEGGPADNQIFAAMDGDSIADNFEAHDIDFVKSDKSAGSRVTGLEQIRNRLRGTDGSPMIYFTEDCKVSIQTLPVVVRDEKNWEDIAKGQRDHAIDAIRYACLDNILEPYTVDELKVRKMTESERAKRAEGYSTRKPGKDKQLPPGFREFTESVEQFRARTPE